MKTPHKHAELIKAWADGAEIEARQGDSNSWVAVREPNWSIHSEYRIKPKPKADVVCLKKAFLQGTKVHVYIAEDWGGENLKLTFDGETGKLKAAEVIA